MPGKIIAVELSYSEIEIIIDLLRNDLESDSAAYIYKTKLLKDFQNALADNNINYYFKGGAHVAHELY